MCAPAGKHLQLAVWHEQVVGIGTLIVRCLMGKKMASHAAKEFPLCSVPTGKLTKEKLNELMGYWTNHLDRMYPEIKFGTVTGWNVYHSIASAQLDEIAVVPVTIGMVFDDAVADPPLLVEAPVPPEEPARAFKVGDVIVCTIKTSLKLSLPDNPTYKRYNTWARDCSRIPGRAEGQTQG